MTTETLTFELDTQVCIALAVSQGWQPMVEDFEQPADAEGNHPLVPNPQTFQEFIIQIAPAYLTGIVLNGGRINVENVLNSIYETVIAQIKAGDYDAQILQNDIDGIKTAILTKFTTEGV